MGSCLSRHELEDLAAGRLADEAAGRSVAIWNRVLHVGKQYEERLAEEEFAARLRDAAGDSTLPDMIARLRHAATSEAGTQKVHPLPQVLEGYEIVREIHRGGQGVVYEAVQRSTRRRVALKAMLGGPFAGPTSKRRFEREIELVAGLRHPNIVAIHDSGIASGNYYFSMDYVDGVRLDEYVTHFRTGTVGEGQERTTKAQGREKLRQELGSRPRPPESLPITDTLRLFVKVCDAVNYAHQHG